MPASRRPVALVAFMASAALLLTAPAETYARPTDDGPAGPSSTTARSGPSYVPGTGRPAKALQGKVIVIDPGHQLGNARHSRQINRTVNAGGFRKACNSTGTATNGGYPEATFVWQVARALKRQLETHGATVRLTRATNALDRWGP